MRNEGKKKKQHPCMLWRQGMEKKNIIPAAYMPWAHSSHPGHLAVLGGLSVTQKHLKGQ